MKQLIVAAAMLASAAGAMAQTNLTVTIGQPGFYGRLDVGDFGRPQVYFNEPQIIQRSVRSVQDPLYLRVPPGHMKKWGKHCSRYNACGRPVYFVRDEWYTNTYAPRYREMRGGGRSERGGYDNRGPRQQVVYEDRGGHGGKHDKHDKGNGKGHGKGHGKGKD